jgi:hypothetical protein
MGAGLRIAQQMSAPSLARLAVAIAMLVPFGDGARAGGFWPFEAEDYPPMYAPAFDPRRGPVWTPNGWSHPQWRHDLPPPYWERGRAFGAVPDPGPPAWRPREPGAGLK